MNPAPIIIRQTHATPRPMVWRALTDPEQMRQWYFEELPDFRAEVGFTTQFDVTCEGRVFPHLWEITEVILGERLAYRWRYGGFTADSTVSWDLTDTGSGDTALTFTHTWHTPLPEDDPILSREACVGGWNYFHHKRLQPFLAAAS